jgi:hypothetical protein
MELNGKLGLMTQELTSWKGRFQELDQERLRQLDMTRTVLEQNKQQALEQAQK